MRTHPIITLSSIFRVFITPPKRCSLVPSQATPARSDTARQTKCAFTLVRTVQTRQADDFGVVLSRQGLHCSYCIAVAVLRSNSDPSVTIEHSKIHAASRRVARLVSPFHARNPTITG